MNLGKRLLDSALLSSSVKWANNASFTRLGLGAVLGEVQLVNELAAS